MELRETLTFDEVDGKELHLVEEPIPSGVSILCQRSPS